MPVMKLALLASLFVLASAPAFAGEGDIAAVGRKAPPFSGPTVDGQTFSLAAHSGQVVLVDFFATWCGPCMTEMPLVERDLWQKYRAAGLVVVAVGREHSVAELATFQAAKHFTFPLVADPHRAIYGLYASQYIPRCYLVGKDGTVKFAATGYNPDDFARLAQAVAAELAR